MNNKKLQTFLPILLSLCMIAGIFIGFKMRDSFPDAHFWGQSKTNTLQEVLHLIETKYVDDVNNTHFRDTAIQQLLSVLDPHSAYLPPVELESLTDDINGNFCGVGVEYDIFQDTLFITKVEPEGPAKAAGIHQGDKVLGVNGKHMKFGSLSSEEIHQAFSGACDSKLQLSILRNSKPLNIEIKRGLIPVKSVNGGYLTSPGIGYIKIEKFTSQTHREFMENLTGLQKKGLKKLILDLRGNGGGVLSEAVEVADEFLDGDKLISYTEGKHSKRKEYRCRRTGQFETGELIVLADEESASASEVLMGALQDWDRAKIIGKRSFGKGLVQEIFDLSNQGALKLTVSRYYTPLGRSIQRSYANGGDAYYQEMADRMENGDSSKTEIGQPFVTPKGKKLYGGNGITPDEIITVAAPKISDSVSRLFNDGIINKFCSDYTTQLTEKDTAGYNGLAFYHKLTIDNSQWVQLNELCIKEKIDLNQFNATDKTYIAKWIKVYMARNIWNDNAMYEILNEDDAVLKRAVELLNQ